MALLTVFVLCACGNKDSGTLTGEEAEEKIKEIQSAGEEVFGDILDSFAMEDAEVLGTDWNKLIP